MLACAAVFVTTGVRAADEGIEFQQSIADDRVMVTPAAEVVEFWDRFKAAFEERTADNFADRFHPFSSLNWSLRLDDGDAEYFHEETSRSARKALTRSVTHGLREASVDLPLMTWLKERQGILADFLRNSVGNVDEESVSPNELTYRVAERSWWDRLSERSGFRYGIRPFRTAPYVYAGMGFRDGETVFLLANVRYIFRNFDEHKFELSLSVPLMQGLSLDVGASYKFDRHDAEQQLALKLFKSLRRGGVFYLGLELREEPGAYAGVSFLL